METQTDTEVTVKYSSYTDAQRKATQKYRNNNRDKVNEQRKKYYRIRKEHDPSFLEYKRTKAKEYYNKKKASLGSKIDFIDDAVTSVPVELKTPEPIVEEVKPVVVVEVPIEPETKLESKPIEEPKQKKSKKSKKV